MRIRFITEGLPYVPARDGYRMYSGNLLRALARRHDIELLTLIDACDVDRIDLVRPYCASVTVVPRERRTLPRKIAGMVSVYLGGRYRNIERRLREAAAKRRLDHCDVTHVEGSLMAGAVTPDMAPGVLSVHDSETLRCQEMALCTEDPKLKLYYRLLERYASRYQRLAYPRFARCVVVAERDRQAIRQVVPDCRVEVIPHGLDTDYFHPMSVQKEPCQLVFHGNLSFPPNVDAVHGFLEEVLGPVRSQLPGTTFHVIGADPVPAIRELDTRGDVRLSANLEDLRPSVCAGAVYVCPVRRGGGLKNKLLEAMAMAMPIVCYPASADAIEGIDGRHFLIARTPKQFAELVVSLLRNPSRGTALGLEGRRLVMEEYSWDSRARTYERLYQAVLDEALCRATNSRHATLRSAWTATTRS